MNSRVAYLWLLPLVFLASIGALELRAQTGAPAAASAPNVLSLTFVGSARCASCHEREYRAWWDSQHAHAMQPARPDTILGNFNDTTFDKDGVVSTFRRRGDAFFVATQGPDGKPGEFEVKFTLGLAPLQQYLVAMSGGRLQAFGIAWDTRPADAGGQRWFDLYPGQKLSPGDPLHWTGIQQTANFMCIDCHVTGFAKNFDVTTNSYGSAWSEPEVGCEACHGPGSAHVIDPRNMRLPARFPDRTRISWGTDPKARPSVPTPSPGEVSEVETCARCHARRSQLTDAIHAGQPFADGFHPALLNRGLYHADGQMQDEVYNFGSFLQSRMFAKGVTCSNCHDPHTQKVRTERNAVCGQCHEAAKYDTRAHHFHDPASKAGECATCHMPTVTYMIVDPRHDHSIRVPRPDLAKGLGTPDVCASCHADKPPGWTAQELKKRLGHSPSGFQTFAEAFAAADRGAPGASGLLARIANDGAQPAIVRASAVARAGALDPALPGVNFRAALADPDPTVRAAAAEAAANGDADPWVEPLTRLLRDPLRLVRIEAAHALAGPTESRLSETDRAAFAAALEEYVAVQRYNADRGEAHMNLALLDIRRGNRQAAADHLARSISTDPTFVPAYVQLADLFGMRREESRADETLRRAVTRNPESGLAHHALGLSLIRQRKLTTALGELSRAVELEGQSARFGYVYAVALEQMGRRSEALSTLDAVLQSHPYDVDSLSAGVAWAIKRGDVQTALGHLETLHSLRPDDRAIEQQIERLQRLPAKR
jgi:tetratricopeptide (TPR) repeat protein